MTTFDEQFANLKDLGLHSIQRVRRNHALEHATLQVISKKNPNLNLAGYSDPKGFWVLGDVDIETLGEGVQEALRRLQDGEHELAIHPNCGTNFVTSGVLAGTAAFVGMLGTERGGLKKKLDRWPIIMAMVTAGLIFAQPLGPKVQQRFTTATDVENMRVLEVMRFKRKDTPLHRVLTTS
jgi:hypothetical protein